MNTNGSALQLYEQTIPYEYYNDGSNPLIQIHNEQKMFNITRGATWGILIYIDNPQNEVFFKKNDDGIFFGT